MVAERHEWKRSRTPGTKQDTAVAAAAAAIAAPAEQRADMVTPADFAAFQQQLRQEVTDVMQQLRAEVNDTFSAEWTC